MSRKRKTREEKVKSSQKKSQNSTYTLDFNKSSIKKSPERKGKFGTKNNDIRRILIASSTILALNLILYTLLSTNILHFGFLGY